jgi:hypothetical protein
MQGPVRGDAIITKSWQPGTRQAGTQPSISRAHTPSQATLRPVELKGRRLLQLSLLDARQASGGNVEG